MTYYSTFEISHRLARLAEQAIASYQGAWGFEKQSEDPPGFKSREVTYTSAFVDVLVLRNPNKCVRCGYKDSNHRNQRSYARFFVRGKEKQSVDSFLRMLALKVPEINNRCKFHRIITTSTGRRASPASLESIENLLE